MGNGIIFIEQAKILRVLEMVTYLAKGRRTVDEMGEKFFISPRTVWRYLNLLETLGIGIEKDWNRRYFIVQDTCPVCGGKHKARRRQREKRTGF